MEAFGLILGHLVGDYIVQNDWMAKNKTNPCAFHPYYVLDGELIGHLACFVHCVLYTLAVGLFSFWWMPWWGYMACFALHFPIDRFRLAALWMKHVSGQASFASKEHLMFPWSIVMVDNIFHLLTLYLIALLAGLTS